MTWNLTCLMSVTLAICWYLVRLEHHVYIGIILHQSKIPRFCFFLSPVLFCFLLFLSSDTLGCVLSHLI